MPFPHVRVVLFDAGNTLIHLDYDFIAALLMERGHAVPPRELRRAEYVAKRWIDRTQEERRPGGDAARRIPYFKLILDEAGVPSDEVEAVVAELDRANLADCLWRVVAPDTEQALTTLRERGLRLGVVSNADGRVEADLHRRGLGAFFETIIDSSVVGVEKPNPRIFQKALAALGARPAESLYVGDLYSIDVKGARYASMDAVLLDPLERYDGVDCTRVRSLGELVEILT